MMTSSLFNCWCASCFHGTKLESRGSLTRELKQEAQRWLLLALYINSCLDGDTRPTHYTIHAQAKSVSRAQFERFKWLYGARLNNKMKPLLISKNVIWICMYHYLSLISNSGEHQPTFTSISRRAQNKFIFLTTTTTKNWYDPAEQLRLSLFSLSSCCAFCYQSNITQDLVVCKRFVIRLFLYFFSPFHTQPTRR